MSSDKSSVDDDGAGVAGASVSGASDDSASVDGAGLDGAGFSDEAEDTVEVKTESGVDGPADGTDGTAEGSGDGNTVKTETGEGFPRWLLLGSAAFALAALIAAAVFGIQWWVTSSKEATGLAAARDDVVRVGGSAIKAYTEVDYTDLDGFFARQKAISDPAMGEQLSKLEPTYRKALSDAKTKVVTTIQDIAVEELNDHEGKASFLAAITTKVSQGDKSSVKALRLEVQMSRIDENGDQVWKLSGIGSVPLVAAGQ